MAMENDFISEEELWGRLLDDGFIREFQNIRAVPSFFNEMFIVACRAMSFYER